MPPPAAGNHKGSEYACPAMALSEAASYPATDESTQFVAGLPMTVDNCDGVEIYTHHLPRDSPCSTSGFPLQRAQPVFPEGGTRSDAHVSPGREQEDTFEMTANSVDVTSHRDNNAAAASPPALCGMDRTKRPRTRARTACTCPNCVSGEFHFLILANGVRKKVHNCHMTGKKVLIFNSVHNRFKQHQSTRRRQCTSNHTDDLWQKMFLTWKSSVLLSIGIVQILFVLLFIWEWILMVVRMHYLHVSFSCHGVNRLRL